MCYVFIIHMYYTDEANRSTACCMAPKALTTAFMAVTNLDVASASISSDGIEMLEHSAFSVLD